MYLAGSDERVEERAEQSYTVVQLERLLVFTEVRRQLNTQTLQLSDVTLQLRQLVASKLSSTYTALYGAAVLRLFVKTYATQPKT